MRTSPLDFPCLHLATPQELERDPNYQACNAAVHEPCCWARRYDDQPTPPFHSERLEQLPAAPLNSALLRKAVLDTGLV